MGYDARLQAATTATPQPKFPASQAGSELLASDETDWDSGTLPTFSVGSIVMVG